MTTVSVIIPVYNAEKYLSKCLDSLAYSTFTDWEAICVNDGSLDSSLDVLNTYAVNDSRFKVFSQQNAGVSAARNLGLSQAHGQYVYFLDSDDYIHPKSLEILINAAVLYDADITFGQDEYVTDYNPNYDKKENVAFIVVEKPLFNYAAKEKDCDFAVLRKLYKKSLLAGLKFDTNCCISEDGLFNFYAFSKAEKIAHTSEKLYFYVYNPLSLVHGQYSCKKIMSFLYVVEKLYEDFYSKPQYADLSRNRLLFNVNNALKYIKKTDDKISLATIIVPRVRDLYARHAISYKGLSFSKKYQLFKILHGKV